MLGTDSVEELQQEEFEETPMYAAVLTYLSYSILSVPSMADVVLALARYRCFLSPVD